MKYLPGFAVLALVLPGLGCQMTEKNGDTVEVIATSRVGSLLGYDSRPIEEAWRPLEVMQERPEMLAPHSRATTIGDTLYVARLSEWVSRGPRYQAAMRHEQEHSRRQMRGSVLAWVAQYAYDRAFMWAEEQHAWFWQLTTLRKYKRRIDPQHVAKILSRLRNLAGPMVGYEEALTWVEAVLSGRWTPAE